MAENGWYPNSLLFFYHPSNEEIKNLDDPMPPPQEEYLTLNC